MSFIQKLSSCKLEPEVFFFKGMSLTLLQLLLLFCLILSSSFVYELLFKFSVKLKTFAIWVIFLLYGLSFLNLI